MATTSSTSSTSKSSDLTALRWKTILEYNELNAFAIPKSKVTDDTLTQYKSVTTDSYKQSTGLLKNMTEKLGTIEGNLKQMLTFAQNGAQARSDKKEETAFAQLRTLSAGIDSIVRSYTLEDLKLFSGRSVNLSYDNGSFQMKLDNLSSSGKDGLGLAKTGDGAFVKISYDYLNTKRNNKTSIAGLDITSASTCKGDPTVKQLTDGKYQVKVEYKGPKSTIYIQNLDGTTIDKAENVDLTGTGQMDVKLGCGVQLSLEKTYFKTALGGDKYDYETFGSVSLYANLSYEKNVQHFLDDGSKKTLVTENSVSVASGRNLSGTTGNMKVSAEVAPVYDGRTQMATGPYSLKIKYAGVGGKSSSLWLYDNNGNLVSTVCSVNLSGTKPVSVDLGTGVSITLDQQNFTSGARTYNTTLNYTAADEPYKVFDFKAYTEKIQEALDTVKENLKTVSDAQEELDSRYSIVQSAIKLAVTGGATQSALSDVLAGALSKKNTVSASDLFGSVNSSVDSSITTVLSDNSITDILTSNVEDLSDVDSSILALYYKKR
jgi:hypothetical protein